MSATKIVLIGAGSASFGLRTLSDLIAQRRSLEGSTLVLVDTDEAALERMGRLARRACTEMDVPYAIEQTTDRREALPGAEFVVISVEVNRNPLWKLDFEIPLKHGVKHVLGENAGPGGLSHTLRTVPLVLEICRDVESLSPHALVLNFTNPESRICMAVDRYTNVRAVGLCHQIGEGYRVVAEVLGKGAAAERTPPEEWLDIKAVGINHFTWMVALRDSRTGEDLYPRFHQALERTDPSFQPLSRRLYDAFGLYPATGDRHAGEMVGYAWEYVGTEGYDFEGAEQHSANQIERIEGMLRGELSIGSLLAAPSGERAAHIIADVACARNGYELSANIRNAPKGATSRCIANLPDDAIVEVPAVVSGDGIRGLNMGALPEGIAAMCHRQAIIQGLSVKAAVEGDRRAALQALLLDPTISGYAQAVALLDDLLATHAAYLPQFA